MKKEQEKSGSGSLYWILAIIIGIPTLMVLIDNQGRGSKVDSWFDDYSLSDCEENVKSKLREPDSYEKIQMLLPTRVSDKEKILRWNFRAKNGFSGYNVLTAECIVKKERNGSILTSTKELN
jgi:hypothetical protein